MTHLFYILVWSAIIYNIAHVCLTHLNPSLLIFHITPDLNYKFAFLHSSMLIVLVLYLFNEINLLTLFLIDKCLVQECLHPYLVVDLIKLKIVLGFQKSPFLLISQFNSPIFGISTISILTQSARTYITCFNLNFTHAFITLNHINTYKYQEVLHTHSVTHKR